MRILCSYRSKICLLHQNLARHLSQCYWNVWMEAGKVEVSQTNHLPSELFAQFRGDLTFFPISLIQSNSFECRGALTTTLVLYHEETTFFPQKRFIFVTVWWYLLSINGMLYFCHMTIALSSVEWLHRINGKTQMQKLRRSKPLNSSACNAFPNWPIS